jgi:hypothetical protein
MRGGAAENEAETGEGKNNKLAAAQEAVTQGRRNEKNRKHQKIKESLMKVVAQGTSEEEHQIEIKNYMDKRRYELVKKSQLIIEKLKELKKFDEKDKVIDAKAEDDQIKKKIDDLMKYYKGEQQKLEDKIDEMDQQVFNTKGQVDEYTKEKSFQDLLKKEELATKKQEFKILRDLVDMTPPENPPSKNQVNILTGRSRKTLEQNGYYTERDGDEDEEEGQAAVPTAVVDGPSLAPSPGEANATSVSTNLQPPAASGANSNTDDVQERYRVELGKLEKERKEIVEKRTKSNREEETIILYNSVIDDMRSKDKSFKTMKQLIKYVEENNRMINQHVTGYSPQPAVAAASSTGSSTNDPTGSSTAAAKTAVQAESTQRNQEGDLTLEEQKQNLLREIEKDLADLNEERANITKKKGIYKSDKNILKVLDSIDRSYGNAVHSVSLFLGRVRNMDMGKIKDLENESRKYDDYKGQRDNVLIEPLKQKLGDLENKYNNGGEGDGGVNGNNLGSDESDHSASAALGVTDAAAERKKEENKIEAGIKTNLLEALKYIKDKKKSFDTLADKKQHIFSFMGNKNMYLPENFRETGHKKIDTKFYVNKQMAVPESVIIYNKLQEQTNENDFDNIADGYSLSDANSSKLETGSQVNDNHISAATPSETEAAEITRLTQQLTDIKAQEEAVKQTVDNQALEIHELKEQAKEAKETAQTAQTATKDLETQAAQAAQEVEASKTEIKKALEKMLTSLKIRLEQEKDNVSEEVNKTIQGKIVEVDGFINNPDLDIKVLTNVEKINKEIENAKYEHEFSANGVKELCESLQELMKQLTRHSRPPLTGGRKTRNKKKKKKSKAKKNKTRRRRRSKA